MKDVRASIVEKINDTTTENLIFSIPEIEFIVKNWVSVHSQHITDAEYNSYLGTMKIKIDRNSTIKH